MLTLMFKSNISPEEKIKKRLEKLPQSFDPDFGYEPK
jgi:hypothetical protein